MIGAILGLVFGSVQLYLLTVGVQSIGGQKIRILPFVVQFICPFAGLGLCMLVARRQLVPCAVAMSAALIVGAVVQFLHSRSHDVQVEKE